MLSIASIYFFLKRRISVKTLAATGYWAIFLATEELDTASSKRNHHFLWLIIFLHTFLGQIHLQHLPSGYLT